MKKELITIILIPLLVLFFLISGIWMLNHKSDYKNSLINFVPENAIGLIQFNWELKNNINPKHKLHQQIENYISSSGMPSALWQHPDIDQLAIVFLKPKKNNEGKLEKLWLIRSNGNIKDLARLNLGNYYFEAYDNNIGGFSKSIGAVKSIEQKSNQYISSNIKNNIDKYDKKLIIGFVSKEKYIEHFKQKNKNYQNYNLFEKYLSSQVEDIIYFEAESREVDVDKLLFDIKIKLNNEVGLITDTDNSNLIGIINNGIVINNLDAQYLINQLEQELDKDQPQSWEKLIKYLEIKYQVQWNDLNTFFKQRSSLVIRPKNNMEYKNNLLDNNSYQYAIVIKVLDNQEKAFNTIELENFITNYFAFKYPERRKKILPDNSSGIELIAEPDNFIFMPDPEMDGMRVVKNNKVEFSYFMNENIIIMANSIGLNKNIINSMGLFGAEKKYNIIIDSDIFTKPENNIFDFIYADFLTYKKNGTDISGINIKGEIIFK